MSADKLDKPTADEAADISAIETAPSEGRRPAAELAAERKFRFGAHVLHEAYDILSCGARLMDLACLFRTEPNEDGRTAVVVCETWRFTKEADTPRIDVQVRSFAGAGKYATAMSCLPPFPLLPATPKRAAWKAVLKYALEYFAATFGPEADRDAEVLRQAREHERFWLMRDAFVSSKLRQLERRLGSARIDSLSETLSKVVWKYLIDPKFLKVVAYARMLRPVSLYDYQKMANTSEVFAHVYRQDRPMLPLYQVMAFGEYDARRPFSIARWTREGVRISRGEPVRLSSPAAYKVLVSMHPAIARAWAEISYMRGAFATLFEVLGRLREEGRIPQPVLWSLVGAFGGGSVCDKFDEPMLARLARVVRHYVRECRRRRALPEFGTYRRAVDSLDLRSALDWCVNGIRDAHELDKHASWSSIERRSRLWHGRIWQEASERPEQSWSSALGHCEISGVHVIPLTTSHALRREGRKMQHCVATYASHCFSGRYRIFALVGRTERATLGIVEVAARWRVDQVRTTANGSVSSHMKGVAQAVARAYRAGGANLAREGATKRFDLQCLSAREN